MSVKDWHEKVIGRIIDEGGGYHREDDKTSTLGMSSETFMLTRVDFLIVNFATYNIQQGVPDADLGNFSMEGF